jgi:Carboxypeptidase regulatory-like domain
MAMRLAMVLVLAVGLASMTELVRAQGPSQVPGGVPGGVAGREPRQPTRPPQAPPRDPRPLASEPVGTGVVRGRVFDAVSGAPLARARVSLSASRQPRSAMTDADGNFALTKLLPGPIYLQVAKSGYEMSMVPDRRRTMRASPLTIADGQTIDDVRVAMFKGTAIAGRVVDQYGDPLEGVMIEAIPLPARGRSRATRMIGRGPGNSSNDIGEFRLAHLEPGSYMLAASSSRMRTMDEFVPYGRTFYPGVPAQDQAQPITIERGQSVLGIELVMQETVLVTVSGTVVSAKGEPITSGQISVMQHSAGGSMSWGDPGTSIKPDGTFEFKLQPGEYILSAMPNRNMRSLVQPWPDKDAERGVLPLTVAGEAMTGLVITTGPGATASGRVVFDGRTAPPTDLSSMTVSFTSQSQSGMPSDRCSSQGPPVRVNLNPDGTFLAEGLWGTCSVQVGPPPRGGWALKGVVQGGTDITNRSIAFQPGQQLRDLQIVFTDRLGTLELSVVDEHGTALQEYVALVFPVDKSRWSDNQPARTYVGSPMLDYARELERSVRTTSTATAAPAPPMPPSRQPIMRGLLAGEYYAVAVDDVTFEDIRDPEFLTQLAPLAMRVMIGDNDSKSIQLRRVALPDSLR